jgi:hypothetical protein
MISRERSSRLVIIPLMGLSKRFSDEGVDAAKWSLTIGSRPMLAWALDTFLGIEDLEFRFVVPRQLEIPFRQVASKCDIQFSVAFLDSATRGQAESVQLALQEQDSERRLWVFNCDSRISPGAFDPNLMDGNRLVCAELQGDHWSFVRVDSNGRVVEVREKQRVSSHCSTGLYSFDTCETFSTAYLKTTFGSTEHYVAPVYNELIRRQRGVETLTISADDFDVFGTPTELRLFCRQRGLGSPI